MYRRVLLKYFLVNTFDLTVFRNLIISIFIYFIAPTAREFSFHISFEYSVG